jgi:hypothetical protein
VIVAPLGRGPIGYYSDISEADVFEVLADADATYRFHPDDWHISGYSMGGYGAMRLGSFYPHLWADMSNWVGFTGDVLNNGTGAPRPTSWCRSRPRALLRCRCARRGSTTATTCTRRRST